MGDHRSQVVAADEGVEANSLTQALHSDFEATKRRLVGFLRERRPGGLSEVLAPILQERNAALAAHLAPEAVSVINAYDALTLQALSMRYDALDTALAATAFAVAEIDGNGLISYANDALKKLLPDAMGREFAALFGPRSGDVSGALASNKRETLRLDLHRGNSPSIHLRGELGPLTDEFGRRGAYALLLDLAAEEARLDALPDGVLRVDLDGKIVFANRRAKEFLDAAGAELHGLDVQNVLSFSDDEPIAELLNPVRGRETRAELQSLNRRSRIPIRLTVVPSFDTAASRAGAIFTITPIANELVRADLQQALSIPDSKPEDLVRDVMRAIRRIVPYDLATFAIFTEDMRHTYTLVVHPEPRWEWTTAWFPLREGVREFLLGPTTFGDIQPVADQFSGDLDNPVYRNIVHEGMKRFTSLPICGAGQQVRASLTLLSKTPDAYNGWELKLMRDLDVEKALMVAQAKLERRQEERISRLESVLTTASEYQKLAKVLAIGIADCFGWDYVAVFWVDRRANVFRLVSQCNRTGYPNVAANYTQPLTEGLLGEALAKNGPLAEDNLEGELRYGYKAVVPGRRSALAVPIRVVHQAAKPREDEIEWMLAVESSQRNAFPFQGPDVVSLKNVLVQCEAILYRQWQNAVQSSLLDAAEQAIIIVDNSGKIRITNRRANTLFRQPGELLLGSKISSLVAKKADRELLTSDRPLAQVRMALALDKDVDVPALATQRPLGDAYGHRLWLFTDLREQVEQGDWGYLEETVNEVAQITRQPLTLAEHLILGAKRALHDGAEELLDRALRQLNKADITFERLSSTLAIRRGPDSPAQPFDAIWLMQEIIADLPEDDFDKCDASALARGGTFMIEGWRDDVRFAIRSLLGHMLFCRPPGAVVRIAREKAEPGLLVLALSVPNSAPFEPNEAKERDRIDAARRRAREMASLAAETVAVALKRHHGEFTLEAQESGGLVTKITLKQPSAVAG